MSLGHAVAVQVNGNSMFGWGFNTVSWGNVAGTKTIYPPHSPTRHRLTRAGHHVLRLHDQELHG
jgi:hypothetical protein